MNKILEILPSLLFIALLGIGMYLWVSSLGERAEAMRSEGVCTVGRLTDISENSSYYEYSVNGKQYNYHNGIVVRRGRIGELFLIIYTKQEPQNGYLVNYKGNMKEYKYGDIICCDVCDEIKKEINHWKM